MPAFPEVLSISNHFEHLDKMAVRRQVCDLSGFSVIALRSIPAFIHCSSTKAGMERSAMTVFV